MALPPPPLNDKPGSFAWLEWYRQLRNYISTSGSVPWYIINFAGSNITDIANRSHNNLQTLQGGTSGEMYHLTSAQHSNLTGSSTTFTDLNVTGNTTLGDSLSDDTKVSGDIVLPKNSGYGVKVDTTTPTFGWRDMLGNVVPKTSGVGSPTLTVFRGGNVRSYAFAAGEDYDGQFHIPHDYVPGTDLFMHVHWSHNGTGITGNLVLNWYFTYAKGHQQDTFPAEVNYTQTIATDITTYPQYEHAINEFQMSTAGGSASQINTSNIEIDGVIMFHLDVTTIPTITGGASNKPFIFYVDIHYQSTGINTKNKAPNFYS